MARNTTSNTASNTGLKAPNVPVAGYSRRPSLLLNLNGTAWNSQQQQPLAASGGGGRHLNAQMGTMI